jgi:AraC-like DNA-binding protein
MPVLPVPMIIALVLSGFLVLRLARRETHWTLLALIGVCAVQSAISALVHYYGLAGVRPLQPVLAMVIPPVAWFAFSWASGGDAKPRRMAWHAIGPVLAVLCFAVNPLLLDVLIPLSFAGYGLAILMRLWRGEDSLLHSRLESGAQPLLAWRIVGMSLIASAASDVMIAYFLSKGHTGVLLWVPSLMSSISLLGLGLLSTLHAIESRRETEGADVEMSPEDISRDQAIIARVDDYMKTHKPYLDPDLTLARLARRLIVPAKHLSAAINRVKGENVSRYINAQRIAEACARMTAGKSVTAAMLECGFNTKSNFNREFLRVKTMSPRQWLDSGPQLQSASLPFESGDPLRIS